MRRAILILLAVSLLPAAWAWADTQYVSDRLIVSMRAGEGDQDEVLKMLKAGTPVEVLQEGKAGRLLVRTQDGTQGWVQQQYITTETPKGVIVARLEKERDQLREQLKKLEAGQAEMTAELENARKGIPAGNAGMADLQKELEKAKADYAELQAKSGNVVELAAERDRLEAQNGQLTAEIEQLRRDEGKGFQGSALKWFLAGAGVLLLGWMMGKSSRKKKGFSY